MKNLTKLLSAAAVASAMSANAPTAQAGDFDIDLGRIAGDVVEGVVKNTAREYERKITLERRCDAGNRQACRTLERNYGDTDNNGFAPSRDFSRGGDFVIRGNNCSLLRYEGTNETTLQCDDTTSFNVRGKNLATGFVGACNVSFNDNGKPKSAVCIDDRRTQRAYKLS